MSEPEDPPAKLDTFDAIYERELDYVWRSLGRLGVPSADLGDAVHEVFLVLHRRWRDVDPARPIRPWLFGVARRVAAATRRERRDVPAVIDPATADDPRDAQRALVWRALDTLDDDRRLVVILHDLEGHTAVEIAAMLEVPVNTVYSRLRLARAELLAVVRDLRRKP